MMVLLLLLAALIEHLFEELELCSCEGDEGAEEGEGEELHCGEMAV